MDIVITTSDPGEIDAFAVVRAIEGVGPYFVATLTLRDREGNVTDVITPQP